MNNRIIKNINKLEKNQPLILNLTNLVTINDVANAILALNASPVMSNSCEDAIELGHLANAVNINIGTVNDDQFNIMKNVSQKQYQKKPIIIDIVGYGATKYRNTICNELIKYCSAIKGNYSEILSLHQQMNLTKGVDSNIKIKNGKQIVKDLANKYKILVMMTGKVDYVSDGIKTYEILGGTTKFTKITGAGCILSGVAAGFLAVDFSASGLVCASLAMKISGENANAKIFKQQTFKNAFLDNLSLLKQIAQKHNYYVNEW